MTKITGSFPSHSLHRLDPLESQVLRQPSQGDDSGTGAGFNSAELTENAQAVLNVLRTALGSDLGQVFAQYQLTGAEQWSVLNQLNDHELLQYGQQPLIRSLQKQFQQIATERVRHNPNSPVTALLKPRSERAGRGFSGRRAPRQASEFEQSIRMQHVTSGAGPSVAAAQETRAVQQDLSFLQNGGNATPQQMINQFQGMLSCLPGLGCSPAQTSAMRQTTSQLQRLVEGPLAQWNPMGPTSAMAPYMDSISEFMGFMAQMLSQMSQLPIPAMPTGMQRSGLQPGFDMHAQMAQTQAKLQRLAGRTPATLSTQPGVAQNTVAAQLQHKLQQAGLGSLTTARQTGVQYSGGLPFSAGAQQAHNPELLTALENTDKIEKALEKKPSDTHSLIRHEPEVLKYATLEQKAALLQKLNEGDKAHGGEGSGERAEAKLEILKTCQSPQEFRQLVEMGGGSEKVIGGIPGKENVSAYRRINILCGQMGSMDLATHDESARLGAEQPNNKRLLQLPGSDGVRPNPDVKAAEGMSKDEIRATRDRIGHAMEEQDRIVSIAKDPKAMALTTPAEKARMIRKLADDEWGDMHTNSKEERAIVEIMLSCTSKEEFEDVYNRVGGERFRDELERGNDRKEFSMLCGMFGRPEWAINRGDAEKVANALVDESAGAELANLNPAALVGPAEPNPATLPADPVRRAEVMNQHRLAKMSADIHREPIAYKKLLMTNAERKSKGEPLLDWSEAQGKTLQAFEKEVVDNMPPQVRELLGPKSGSMSLRQIEIQLKAIAKQPDDKAELFKQLDQMERVMPGMSAKVKRTPQQKAKDALHAIADQKKNAKKHAIDTVRKEYGLAEHEMRDMFTMRMSEIYASSTEEYAADSQDALHELQAQYQEMVKRHGEHSREAEAAKARLIEAQGEVGHEIERMVSNAELAKDLYPVPLSAMDKFVAAMEDFGKIFTKILDLLSPLLNIIPGVGSALFAAYQGVKAIVNAAMGNAMGVVSSVISAIPAAGSAIGGAVGTAMEIAGKTAQGVKGIVDAVREKNPLAALGALGGVAGGLGKVGGSFGDAMKTAQKVINAGTSGATFMKGAAEGNFDAALAGLGGVVNSAGSLAGGDAQKVLNRVGQGIKGINDIANGRFGSALSHFNGAAGDLLGKAINSVTKDFPAELQGIWNDITKYVKPEGLVDFTGHMINGNYDKALGSLPGTLGSEAKELFHKLGKELPPDFAQAIGEISRYAAPGYRFIESLSNGNVSGAFDSLTDATQTFLQSNPAAQSFLARPENKRWTDVIQPGAQFVKGILNGNVSQALQGTTDALGSLFQQPELQTGLDWMQRASQVAQGIQKNGAAGAFDALQKSGVMQEALSAIQSGALGKGVVKVANDVRQFLEDPHVKQGVQWLNTGADFVQNLVNGDLTNALQGIAGPGSPLAGTPVMQTLQNFANDGQQFVGGLLNGNLGRSLGQLQQAMPALAAHQAYQEFLQQAGPLASFAGSLYNAELPQTMQQMMQQLQSVTYPAPILDLLIPYQEQLNTYINEAGSVDSFLRYALTPQ